MFNKSLTIVLPVHNAEARLRKSVRELLELAGDLTAKFGVLIIDDGSTDATFEVAEELASYFPQVSVRRHRRCLGLGASIEYVQRRVRSDAVIVHDGVTPIDTQQVQKLWRRWIDESTSGSTKTSPTQYPSNDAIERSNLRSIHSAMEGVHRQIIGFQLMRVPQTKAAPMTDAAELATLQHSDACHTQKRAGVGRIPSLPRPKFLSAVAEFAFGE